MTRIFTDRSAAGVALAEKLKSYKTKAVVLALPRGGVATAIPIARLLKVPLTLSISRKIGHPSDPEFAIGAVTETGPVIWNESEANLFKKSSLKRLEQAERLEARRRRKKYLADRPSVQLTGKAAILVDDGAATGLTMLATIQEVKNQKPAKIIIAIPVAPADTVAKFQKEVDEVITLIKPGDFCGAVGSHYLSFPQLDDNDVIKLLDEAEKLVG